MISLNKIRINNYFYPSFKKGMTMTEVVITIGIFSIILVAINQLFIKSWKNYNFTMNINKASIAANRGSSAIIDVLRKVKDGANGGYPIISANKSDLKIYSDIDKDGVVEKVHYYLSGTDLMVGVSNPSGFPLNYPTSDSETKLIVKDIVNNSSQPLFYYYNNQNNTITSPVANLIDVRMIEINLFVARKEGNLNIESYASLRNLNENDTIE